MGLLERWDRRNQETLEAHNEVSWEEFSRPPDDPVLRAWYLSRFVVLVIGCFVFLVAVVVALARAVLH